MLVKDIIDVVFQDYQKASMFIATCYCDFKCCTEQGLPVSICQNCNIVEQPNVEIDYSQIFDLYMLTDISEAIVIGGFEPMLQFDDIYNLIEYFRDNGIDDDFVIYTGYYPNEVQDKITKLQQFKNIIIKFGRYIPNIDSRFDEVLGVTLISNNQFAERIS